MLNWGFRMALAGTVPVAWGVATGRVSDAVWITLTAEAVTWVELKGSFTWRLRVLLAGAALAIMAGMLGSVTGSSIWLGCLAMFGVGFIATLLKNVGDRASGLSICFYLLFIVCNAFPAITASQVHHRTMLIAIGAVWPVIVGVVASAFAPVQEPFRRQIAQIWRTISQLTEAVSHIDSRAGYSAKLADVYKKETEVRAALNSSFEFNAQSADQANTKDNRNYQLVMLRKIAGLVAVNVIAMGDEMEHIAIHKLDKAIRVKAAALFGALREASGRMSAFVITMNPEEKLLVISQINRLRRLTTLIREYPSGPDNREAEAIARILQLTGRTINLLENAILRIDEMGGDTPVFRSYSLIKTSFLYTPKYLLRNLPVLFNFNTLTFKFALRSATAATLGLFIYKWFNIDHGYWIPFSIMIVIQPFFGATFKKAIDRVAGTLLGVLAGGALLYLPKVWYIQEIVLFLTFLLMVYFVKKNYAIAAFFITLNLVLLFNIETTYSNAIMASRAISTVGGSLLAIMAGWLLPTWDKKLLPEYIVHAIVANREYFINSFFSPDGHINWTRFKRMAESENSNAFDSFNRYMHEPGHKKSGSYYDLIAGNVRITRNINNMHMEQAEKSEMETAAPTQIQVQKAAECLELFRDIIENLQNPRHAKSAIPANLHETATYHIILNDAQLLSLEKIIVELKTMQADITHR